MVPDTKEKDLFRVSKAMIASVVLVVWMQKVLLSPLKAQGIDMVRSILYCWRGTDFCKTEPLMLTYPVFNIPLKRRTWIPAKFFLFLMTSID